MSEDLIKNQFVEPNVEQILEYMNEYAKENWIEIANFLESEYKAKPVVMYSKCSAKPGWNVKYKKGSKSMCTMYPDKEYFTILLVLGEKEITKIREQKNVYSKYFLDIMENSGSLNCSKWLMIGIDDNIILEDIKKAVIIKNEK